MNWSEGMMWLAWWWFCWCHLPRVPQEQQLFTISMWSQRLLKSCTLFVDACPRLSSETAETETLLRRPWQPHFPKKKRRVSRSRMFPSWIHAFLISHTSQLLDDNVLALMIRLTWWWLTWWCGCDGKKKLAMTIVRNSEVSELPLIIISLQSPMAIHFLLVASSWFAESSVFQHDLPMISVVFSGVSDRKWGNDPWLMTATQQPIQQPVKRG